MAAAGRNDPCPCGSGRKFKRCCIDETPLPRPSELRGSARRLTLDFAGASMSAELRDGRTITEQLPRALRTKPTGVTRLSLAVAERELEATLPGGRVATIEMASPAQERDRLGDRKIVYLDQCHWIALARHRWAPKRLSAADRKAAPALIELVRTGQIVLPMSAAHLVESAPTDGERREHFADVLLDLSRGWQMRNPVRVRQREIARAVSGRPPVASGVFTLEPYELFSLRLERYRAPPDAGFGWEVLLPHLSAISAIVAEAAGGERVDMAEAHATADAWAAEHQALAVHLRDTRATPSRKRLAAHGRLLGDLSQEIAFAARESRAGLGAFETWLARLADDGLSGHSPRGRVRRAVLTRAGRRHGARRARSRTWPA